MVWDTSTDGPGGRIATIDTATNDAVWCCTFSADATLIALGSGDGSLELYSADNGDVGTTSICMRACMP